MFTCIWRVHSQTRLNHIPIIRYVTYSNRKTIPIGSGSGWSTVHGRSNYNGTKHQWKPYLSTVLSARYIDFLQFYRLKISRYAMIFLKYFFIYLFFIPNEKFDFDSLYSPSENVKNAKSTKTNAPLKFWNTSNSDSDYFKQLQNELLITYQKTEKIRRGRFV